MEKNNTKALFRILISRLKFLKMIYGIGIMEFFALVGIKKRLQQRN
jgi:hypothetical protein